MRCVKRTNHDVVIVSRDADYGIVIDGQAYANDWLTQELKARVNQQRKLLLFTRLSEALREFEINVSKEEEQEEEIQLAAKPSISREDMTKQIEEFLKSWEGGSLTIEKPPGEIRLAEEAVPKADKPSFRASG